MFVLREFRKLVRYSPRGRLAGAMSRANLRRTVSETSELLARNRRASRWNMDVQNLLYWRSLDMDQITRHGYSVDLTVPNADDASRIL